MKEILRLPEVPEGIIEAVNNNKLAVFIGAGASRLVGCKGWDQLAKNLVDLCFSTKNENGDKLINFKEKEFLAQNKNYKKTITICYGLLKDHGNIFYEELENSLEANERSKNKNIYDELYNLRALFITTNADTNFDGKFEPTKIVYKEDDFDYSKIDINKLYKIHGSIGKKDDDIIKKDKYWKSLVFTVPQYIKRYRNTKFRDFLNKIFAEYTVLFVGYGMSEFEVIDFVIEKFGSSKKEDELKHFILLPFYREEKNILRLERDYYSSMGIKVIPYEKDELGYEQLYEVIKYWNKEINQTSGYLSASYEKIENIVNNYNKNSIEDVFQIIRNDKPQENYFFDQLAKAPNPFPWLKELKKRGYFNPEKNPKPYKTDDQKELYKIPYWNVLGYLEDVAEKNEKNPKDEITELLSEIVNKIIDYEYKKRIDNHKTNRAIIKIIFSLPIEKITEKHIEFIKAALNSKWSTTLISVEIGDTVFPKLLKENAKSLVLKLLDVIFNYRKSKKESYNGKEVYEYTSIMDKNWLKELLKNHKEQVANLCGIEAARIAIKKIRNIIEEDNAQFNIVWIPTIEDHPQTLFPDRYECQLVYFLRDMFRLSKPKDIKDEIQNLLQEKRSIFKRIALHIIDYYYEDLSELFWNWKGNPLEEMFIKHELYELLKNNCSSFSDDQIKRVLNWIESKNYYIPNDAKGDADKEKKIIAYAKKLDHPGFDYWHSDVSKYEDLQTKKFLLNEHNEEVAEYLTNFKPKKGFLYDEEDLANDFKNHVVENPEKIANNIKPFLNVPRRYQYSLLQGFYEALRLNKEIDWNVIFDFISDLIKQDGFWNEKYKGYNYTNWIVSQIAELIEEGTKNDEHAFESGLLPKAEEILLILAERTESDSYEEGDIVFYLLNSHKGKVFSAMVNYSLRYTRFHKSNDEVIWPESIKKDFTKRLDHKAEPSIEFSFVVGKYLSDLYRLDKNWVVENINKIFTKDEDNYWKIAFTGYLYGASIVYKDVYFMLRENEHYSKAIKTDFEESHIMERLVQHICVGYIQDWESIEDKNSLLSQLFENKDENQILEIIDFFAMKEDNLNDKIKSKVKPLWRKLYELLKMEEENPKYKKAILKLLRWLALIDEIDDEVFEWLKFSANHIDYTYDTHYFIEDLLKHVSKTPKKVGQLYVEMLNNDAYPQYEQEYIEKLVETLYEKNEKEVANRICNLCGSAGFYFLKEIYYKYNKENKS